MENGRPAHGDGEPLTWCRNPFESALGEDPFRMKQPTVTHCGAQTDR
jgi:hypothetical protein